MTKEKCQHECGEKNQHISWTVVTMVKSVEADKNLKDTAMHSGYLSTKLKSHVATPRKLYVAKKLPSPHPTPRQIKRQKVTSPQKISNQEVEVDKALRCISRRQYL